MIRKLRNKKKKESRGASYRLHMWKGNVYMRVWHSVYGMGEKRSSYQMTLETYPRVSLLEEGPSLPMPVLVAAPRKDQPGKTGQEE